MPRKVLWAIAKSACQLNAAPYSVQFSGKRFLVLLGERQLTHVDELQVRFLKLAQQAHDFLEIVSALGTDAQFVTLDG